MKGAILSRAPAVPIVDLCHEVEPQAIDEAGFLLASAATSFPEGTVFAAVVDPGVGSARAIAILEAGGRTFVAPDNGLLALVLARLSGEGRAFHAGAEHYRGASATFHGRDVIAPLAARLAQGEPADALGRPVATATLAPHPAPLPRRAGPRAIGRVVHIDRFGDLVSDVAPPPGAAVRSARLAGREVARPARTYADVEPGALVLYEGSFGTLEVAVRDGSAARALGVARGAAFEALFEDPMP
jgi:S-adenosylmethionine hydrolase